MAQEVRLIVDHGKGWLRNESGELVAEDRWINLPWSNGRYFRYQLTTRPISPPRHALCEQGVEVVLILDNGNGIGMGRSHIVDFAIDGCFVITEDGLEILPREVAIS
jgi:hypothetical protein